MCTVRNLKTERGIITAMERRQAKKAMSYKQIQFNSDCVCKYAGRKGLDIGKVFNLLEKYDGVSFLNRSYTTNPKQSIRTVVDRLDKYLKSKDLSL